MKNQKKTGELKFRDYFGTTAMSVTDGLASTVMTGLFMLYLTDYAGIGQWGAILGSGLLMFARLFDAINDPFEGWLMDRGKITKYGKYRPFIFLSILMTAAGLCGLFSLPSVFADNPVMICVWVIVFYLLYDMGATFYAPNLIYRTLSLDSNDRSKLLIAPRALNMIIGMVGAAIIMIVNGINTALGLNSMHDAFSVAIISMMLISAVLSLLGIALIKERHIPETTKEDKVKVTDIFGMIKTNGALRIRLADMLFTGFIWNFLFATATYYAKWAYCTDLTTGAVDTAKLGTFTMVSSLLMFFPLIIGTLVASPIMKAIGSPIRFHRSSFCWSSCPAASCLSCRWWACCRVCRRSTCSAWACVPAPSAWTTSPARSSISRPWTTRSTKMAKTARHCATPPTSFWARHRAPSPPAWWV